MFKVVIDHKKKGQKKTTEELFKEIDNLTTTLMTTNQTMLDEINQRGEETKNHNNYRRA